MTAGALVLVEKGQEGRAQRQAFGPDVVGAGGDYCFVAADTAVPPQLKVGVQVAVVNLCCRHATPIPGATA